MTDSSQQQHLRAARHVAATVAGAVGGAVLGLALGPIGAVLGGAAGATVAGGASVGSESAVAVGEIVEVAAKEARPLLDGRAVLVAVVVPAGCKAGTRLQVTTRDGRRVLCKVPPGCPAGSLLHLHYTLTDGGEASARATSTRFAAKESTLARPQTDGLAHAAWRFYRGGGDDSPAVARASAGRSSSAGGARGGGNVAPQLQLPEWLPRCVHRCCWAPQPSLLADAAPETTARLGQQPPPHAPLHESRGGGSAHREARVILLTRDGSEPGHLLIQEL